MAMIYTTQTKAALCLAYAAHSGQRDKSGMPYVFHPFHLAEQMHTEDEVCTALLHDVLEDSNMTLDELRAAGIHEEVLEALVLLTHDPSVPYLEYVASLRHNPLARAVKIADLRHNSDLTRFDKVSERDLARVRKYAAALDVLGATQEA